VNHERLEKVQGVYEAALRLDPENRHDFLAEACSGDSGLKREVESLLQESTDVSVLDKRALEIAADSLAKGAADFFPGRQIGSYKILALLGAGGMGEVYRARDLKLKREVSIKILPDDFSQDTDRVSRFQREAEVLASLNHPNIAGIYDVEDAGGSRYLVLELVEGETLADRIARCPIPVEEAMRIAVQICEALEAAHERGIIHRDLKPSNVKVTPEGKIKVLDFGLAKAMESNAPNPTVSQSPTLLTGSMAGMIIGTAAYMSPEQCKIFDK
jgi:serine/threonine protein kinase